MNCKPDPATHPAINAERKRMLEARVLADRHGGAYAKAYPSRITPMNSPVWVPPKNEYPRPGAGDAAKIKSKGI